MALTFKQGIHPEYFKNKTRDKALRKAKRPEKVIIPLKQHIGAPCQPLVEEGDHVDLGQKIGDVDSFISAPVHASVSGTIEEIKEVKLPNRDQGQAIIINPDQEDKLAAEIESSGSLEDLNSDDIRNIIREAGITGMGGAMFPTHAKISIPEEKEIEHFILNGAECEPFLTVDHRIMIERTEDVIFGMKVLMKAIEVDKGIIAIEDNKPEAISKMKDAVKSEENIEVKVFATKYPQGGEKLLIKAALGKEVPAGGLPLDIGVVVNNVSTALAVAEAITEGKPLMERALTISGTGIKEPSNLIFKIGTPLNHLIEEAGGFQGSPGKIILGGPMMGVAQQQTDIPLDKGTTGIIVLPRSAAKEFESVSCINCARCVDSCPMHLEPTRLKDFVQHDMFAEMEKYSIDNCIECGCCSYVCPAKIPLVHYIRMGKAKLRAQESSDNNG